MASGGPTVFPVQLQAHKPLQQLTIEELLIYAEQRIAVELRDKARGGRDTARLAELRGSIARSIEVYRSAGSLPQSSGVRTTTFHVVTDDGTLLRGRRYGIPEARNKIILIMGFCGSHQYWEHQCMGDAESRPLTVEASAELAVFDNRGSGSSARPWGSYSTKLLAHDAYCIIEHLGWLNTGERGGGPDIDLHLVAHSMGGMIAQELGLLLLSKRQLKTTTLAATHSGGWRVLPQLIPCILYVLAGLLAALVFGLQGAVVPLLPLLHNVAYCNTPVDATTKGWRVQRALYSPRPPFTERRRDPLPGVIGQTCAVVTHWVNRWKLARYKSAGVRCLVIAAADDCVLHPFHSQHIAAAIGCPLITLQAGHMLTQQQPGLFNSVVGAHVRGDCHSYAECGQPLAGAGGAIHCWRIPIGWACHVWARIAVFLLDPLLWAVGECSAVASVDFGGLFRASMDLVMQELRQQTASDALPNTESCSKDTSIEQALALMSSRGIHSIRVVDGDALLGVVDLCEIMFRVIDTQSAVEFAGERLPSMHGQTVSDVLQCHGGSCGWFETSARDLSGVRLLDMVNSGFLMKPVRHAFIVGTRGQLLGEVTQLQVLQYICLYRDLVAATTRVAGATLEELGMHKRPVLCLDASNRVLDALKRMKEHRADCAAVVDRAGLLTQALTAKSLQGITADGLIKLNRPIWSYECRSPPLCTVRKSDSLWQALQQLVTCQSTSAFVVDDGNRPTGHVTAHDVIEQLR